MRTKCEFAASRINGCFWPRASIGLVEFNLHSWVAVEKGYLTEHLMPPQPPQHHDEHKTRSLAGVGVTIF